MAATVTAELSSRDIRRERYDCAFWLGDHLEAQCSRRDHSTNCGVHVGHRAAEFVTPGVAEGHKAWDHSFHEAFPSCAGIRKKASSQAAQGGVVSAVAARLVTAKAAIEPLGGLPAALLLRQALGGRARRGLLVAAALALLRGEVELLQRCQAPERVLHALLGLQGDQGTVEEVLTLLRLLQLSGYASLGFCYVAASRQGFTPLLISLACLNATRCADQAALNLLIGTEPAPGGEGAGVHWPFLGACLGGILLRFAGGPQPLLMWSALPGAAALVWSHCAECTVRWAEREARITELEDAFVGNSAARVALIAWRQRTAPRHLTDGTVQSQGDADGSCSTSCITRRRVDWAGHGALPELIWEVCLPLGIWGPWLSNPAFRTAMAAFAASLAPFELAVLFRGPAAAPAELPGAPRTPLISLQLLRVLGVAHVIWFHQLHEGSPLEVSFGCATSISGSSILCHLGMVGMYWVGFFFILSGFVNSYQSSGRQKGDTQSSQHDGGTFACKRFMEIFPQYLVAVVLGGLAAFLRAGDLHTYWAAFGNTVGVVKATLMANIVTYPFHYHSLEPLTHLWYVICLALFWLRFEEWQAFIQSIQRKNVPMVLLYCWLSTLAVPFLDQFGLFVPGGSLMQSAYHVPRYFAFYHPVNCWMYFVGGIGLARLAREQASDSICDMHKDNSHSASLSCTHGADDQGRMNVKSTPGWALRRLVAKWGATMAIVSAFIILAVLDWKDPANIIFRVTNGYVQFPMFGFAIFAASMEEDFFLSLPAKLGFGRLVQFLAELSTPAFLLHKPLYWVQWNGTPFLFWKAAGVLSKQPGSGVATVITTACHWVYYHGFPIHWAAVSLGGYGLHRVLPRKIHCTHTCKVMTHQHISTQQVPSDVTGIALESAVSKASREV